MDQHTIELLELTTVRDRLAGMAAFEGGAALARALEPATDPRRVAALRDVTAESVFLWEQGLSGPGGAHDITDDVEDARRGSRLEPTALERIRATAEVAGEMRAAIDEHAEAAPILAEVADRISIGALQRIAARLETCLD
ncbi:MAG: hypothetical protein WCK40_09835, partial [Thermoleophilia bacterium]